MAEVALAREMRTGGGGEVGALWAARAAVVGEEESAGRHDARTERTEAQRGEATTDARREAQASSGGRRGKRARTSGRIGAAGPSEEGAVEETGAERTEECDSAETAAHGATAATPRRPKRTGIATASYVHTRRYNKKARSEAYMLRNGQTHVLSKRALEIGPATVERAVRGRYEWRDGGLRKRPRGDETREGGERRLRPRDPGKEGK
jgi:hypothetical protein